MKNPIYRKELRQHARSYRVVIVLTVFQIVLAVMALFTYYVSFANTGRNGYGVSFSDIISIYRLLATAEFVFSIVITPGLLAGAVCGERERQTFEVLMSTPLTVRKILEGKLGAAIQVMMLLLISALPVFAVVFAVGGITIADLLIVYLCLFGYVVLTGCISLFFSVMCQKTANAVVLSYLTLFGLTLLSFGIVIMVYFFDAPQTMALDYRSVMYGWVAEEAVQSNWNLLLLFNPFCTFQMILMEQTGTLSIPVALYGGSGAVITAVRHYWIPISLISQGAIGVILYVAAIRRMKRQR